MYNIGNMYIIFTHTHTHTHTRIYEVWRTNNCLLCI